MIGPDDADHNIWLAVVSQARDDVADEPWGSTEYRQAEAFLAVDSPYWRLARADVAAHLGIHGDDIRRAGLRLVNARRLKEGYPPLQTQAPTPCLPKQRVVRPVVAAASPKPPLPRLVAIPAPEQDRPRRHQPGSWRQRWNFNPFAPLPSELRKAG
jgi:hypothetical protein